MRVIGVISCVVLGCVFLASGALKSVDARMPVMATAAYDILPAWTTVLVGALLPAIELVVGAALLTGWHRRAAASWTVLLGLVFAAANGTAMSRALLIDCQCFGGLGGSSPMIAFLVDATVVVLGVFVFRGSRRRVES